MVILGLCVAALLWKPISWSSRRTMFVLTLLPESVWNSIVSVATDDRLFFHATCFSTRQTHSVSLCGLPLRWWGIVAPRRFRFTITALKLTGAALAGQKFDELTCWKGGIRWRCHVESHWALKYKAHSTANVCLWRLHGCVLHFIHLSAMGVAEIAKSTN